MVQAIPSLQPPSIGRVVHYQSLGTPNGEHPSAAYAAIVTAVDGERVSLFVMYPNGTSNKSAVPYSDEPRAGHWSWPPRV